VALYRFGRHIFLGFCNPHNRHHRNTFSHRVPFSTSKRQHFFSIPRSLIQNQKRLIWVNKPPFNWVSLSPSTDS
jgi:hypothetical protein